MLPRFAPSDFFFVWELEGYYFLLKLKSSGRCLKSSLTVWAAWSRIKSTRSARKKETYRRVRDKDENNASESNRVTDKMYKLNFFTQNNSASLTCGESKLLQYFSILFSLFKMTLICNFLKV